MASVHERIRQAWRCAAACALALAVTAAADADVAVPRPGIGRTGAGVRTPPAAQDGAVAAQPPGRWQRHLQAFAAQDLADPPQPGGVVFVGSSSISLWHGLQRQFPGHRVVARGLGGATLADCVQHLDRLVLPHRPRLVVVYAGDNDLAQGMAPDAVLRGFVALAQRVHQVLPATRVAFLSIKPSLARAALLPQVRQANALVAAHVAAHASAAAANGEPVLDYIDVFTPMLDARGRPRADLLAADALHLNAAGYALWSQTIDTHLD